MTKIKICGLTRFEDIVAVNSVLPEYAGFVFAQSRRKVSIQEAFALQQALAKNIVPIGVFVNPTLNELDIAINKAGIRGIQLHGDEKEDFINQIKKEWDFPVIKAVAMKKNTSIHTWDQSQVDYLLLDTPGGGTGQTFDWSLIPKFSKPYFLAGGLTAENVKQALKLVEPFGVDVSSGVETEKYKDSEKIKSFVRSVRHGG